MSSDAPPQRHPDLEGYVSPHRSQHKRPRFLPDWFPINKHELTRWKINTRLWFHFDGSARVKLAIGTAGVLVGTYLAMCWMQGISPYFAVSEDPNTAFKHPYWQEQINARTQREKEMRERIVASNHNAVAGGGALSNLRGEQADMLAAGKRTLATSALEHATKAYSSQNAADRLS